MIPVALVFGWGPGARDRLLPAWASARYLAALGVLEVICLECEGAGEFYGHPDHDVLPCVDCKATGRIFVSG